MSRLVYNVAARLAACVAVLGVIAPATAIPCNCRVQRAAQHASPTPARAVPACCHCHVPPASADTLDDHQRDEPCNCPDSCPCAAHTVKPPPFPALTLLVDLALRDGGVAACGHAQRPQSVTLDDIFHPPRT